MPPFGGAKLSHSLFLERRLDLIAFRPPCALRDAEAPELHAHRDRLVVLEDGHVVQSGRTYAPPSENRIDTFNKRCVALVQRMCAWDRCGRMEGRLRRSDSVVWGAFVRALGAPTSGSSTPVDVEKQAEKRTAAVDPLLALATGYRGSALRLSIARRTTGSRCISI